MKKQLNIIHIASGDIWAGAETQLLHLVRCLNNEDYIKISVILFNHGILEKKLKSLKINTIIIDEHQNSAFKILSKIYKHLKFNKPNIVHTHGYKEGIIGSIPAFFIKGVKSIRTEHGAPEISYPFWIFHKHIMGKLNIFCAKYLQEKIIAVSDDLKILLTKYYPAKKIALIENGIDCEEIIEKSKEVVSLPCGSNTIYCALICRLVDVKRPDIFLHAANIIIQESKVKNICFCILGEGPLYKELSDYVHQHKLNKYVHLLGFQQNIPSFLNKMHICLITSTHEGLPINLLEAMLTKTHVISHAVGGIPHVLLNGEYGTLIRNQTANDYAKAIEDISCNLKLYDKRLTQAKNHVQSNYSINSATSHYLDLYKSLVQQPKLQTIIE